MLISRFSGLILSLQYPTTFLANLNCSMYKLGEGGLLPKKAKTTANFKLGTGFFLVFPFWPILIGLTGSC